MRCIEELSGFNYLACACLFFKGTAVYQSEEDKDSDAEQSSTTETNTAGGGTANSQKRTDVEELALDPNHNYFIFAETAKTDRAKGREAEVRARFERCISLWSTSTPESEPPLSAPRLSQGGGRSTSMGEGAEDYATTLKRKSTLVRNASQKGDDTVRNGHELRPLGPLLCPFWRFRRR